jgi:hypothetical protein
VLIDVGEKVPQVLVGIVNVLLVMKRDLFFLDRAHQALGIAVLCRFANSGHTAMGPDVTPGLNIDERRILGPLVGVMKLRPMLRPGPPQGGQGQRLVQMATPRPTADAARLDVHQHRQVDELLTHPHIRDVCHPDVVGADNGQILPQSRVARVRMGALRRPGTARGALAL